MKKFLFLTILVVAALLSSCSTLMYGGSPTYNVSILDEEGVVVQQYLGVTILSQEVEGSITTLTFTDSSNRTYTISGSTVVVQEVNNTLHYRSSYYVYYRGYWYDRYYMPRRYLPLPRPRRDPPPPRRVEPRPRPRPEPRREEPRRESRPPQQPNNRPPQQQPNVRPQGSPSPSSRPVQPSQQQRAPQGGGRGR